MTPTQLGLLGVAQRQHCCWAFAFVTGVSFGVVTELGGVSSLVFAERGARAEVRLAVTDSCCSLIASDGLLSGWEGAAVAVAAACEDLYA